MAIQLQETVLEKLSPLNLLDQTKMVIHLENMLEEIG